MADSDLKTRDSSSQDKDFEKHPDGLPTSIAVINASGHVSCLLAFLVQRLLWYVILTGCSEFLVQVDQLQRQYGVLSICSTALTIGRLTIRLLGYDDLTFYDTAVQIMRGWRWVGVSP